MLYGDSFPLNRYTISHEGRMMPKYYTTRQAAAKVGVHFLTLHRYLQDGKIKPKGIPLPKGKNGKSKNLWLWTDADIAKAKSLKLPKGRPRKEAK